MGHMHEPYGSAFGPGLLSPQVTLTTCRGICITNVQVVASASIVASAFSCPVGLYQPSRLRQMQIHCRTVDQMPRFMTNTWLHPLAHKRSECVMPKHCQTLLSGLVHQA